MLSQIITHINEIVEGMPFFTTVYGLSELKTDKDITLPVHYLGDGKYKEITLADFGFVYWRKRSDVSFAETASFVSCSSDYVSTFPMRLFAITKRSEFPNDDAYIPERLAGTLIKAITHDGGDLKRQIGARQLSVKAKLYSTNSENIINSEFKGVALKDFNYRDLVVAIDVDIVITKNAPCYEDPCNYTPRFSLQLETYVALP